MKCGVQGFFFESSDGWYLGLFHCRERHVIRKVNNCRTVRSNAWLNLSLCSMAYALIAPLVLSNDCRIKLYCCHLSTTVSFLFYITLTSTTEC